MERPEEEPCFANMQHAIVEALHELGANSPFNDGSVRMKELFAKVENACIDVNGHTETGPHRFSIFNSALCGRRSAAELFERVDTDEGRHGAWWRLRMPYEDAVKFAKEQKGFKAVQTRTRQKSETTVSIDKIFRSTALVNWNKTDVIDSLDRIQKFAHVTANLREENMRMNERAAQLDDEIAQLRQSVPKDVLDMVKVYQEARERATALRQLLLDTQRRLLELSDKAIVFQDM